MALNSAKAGCRLRDWTHRVHEAVTLKVIIFEYDPSMSMTCITKSL